MDFGAASQTSPTLLGLLRESPNDQVAWAAFVDRYGPRVYAWCREWGIQEADAQDVTQNVLLRLAQRLRTFVNDPALSFRGWLHTLTQHALTDYLAAAKRPDRASGDERVFEVLKTAEARTTLVERLDKEFDSEVIAEAVARVRLRVQPHNWEAFRLTTQEGLSGAATATRLGMNVTGVYKAKSRVIELLQKEISRLDYGSKGAE